MSTGQPSTFANIIQEAYIAYYGRPADPTGLVFWENQISQSGSLDSIMQSFGSSPEASSLYGNSDTATQITNIYQQLFNRAPDSSGLAFYEQQIQNGAMSLQTVALNVLNGASGNDAAIIQNKLSVASNFTSQLTQTNSSNYNGSMAASNARKFLSTVDGTNTTLTHAISATSNVINDLNHSIDTDLANAGLVSGGTSGGSGTSTTPSGSADPAYGLFVTFAHAAIVEQDNLGPLSPDAFDNLLNSMQMTSTQLSVPNFIQITLHPELGATAQGGAIVDFLVANAGVHNWSVSMMTLANAMSDLIADPVIQQVLSQPVTTLDGYNQEVQALHQHFDPMFAALPSYSQYWLS